MARILCVDDDPRILRILERILPEAGYEYLLAANVGEAFHLLERNEVDLIVSDYQLPGIDGLEFLAMLRNDRNETPVIMVTGHGGINHAMDAVRAGADDYLLKPFDAAELVHRVAQSLERRRLRMELDALRQEAAAGRSSRQMLGNSPAIRRIQDIIVAAAQSRATVLIEGESGTGKELIARAIHGQSDRKNRPYIQLNCAALPEGLIESALFGHEKGAFTGAVRRSEGAFERANGGSLLLDEVSEMRLDLQAKLLRVLQEREFERVGGSETIAVDVRVIATTNRNLLAAVEAGSFRVDLYYRLHVVGILAPPLRDRLGDVPLLAHHFASRSAAEIGKRIDAISPAAVDLLQSYSWPGNIRELQHVIERAVVLATGPVLDVDAFDVVQSTVRQWDVRSEALRGPAGAGSEDPECPHAAIALPTLNLADATEAITAQALKVAENNRTHAAALLGIGVRTLRKQLNSPGRESRGSEATP